MELVASLGIPLEESQEPREPGDARGSGADRAQRVVYVASVGVVGWLFFRWSSARAEAWAVRERERVRRLRKKGQRKSRAARESARH
jgi:hypothetical protein